MNELLIWESDATKSNILKCPDCSSDLSLTIAFNGCDWETEAGEGSGYTHPLHFECTSSICSRLYTLGYLKGLNLSVK